MSSLWNGRLWRKAVDRAGADEPVSMHLAGDQFDGRDSARRNAFKHVFDLMRSPFTHQRMQAQRRRRAGRGGTRSKIAEVRKREFPSIALR